MAGGDRAAVNEGSGLIPIVTDLQHNVRSDDELTDNVEVIALDQDGHCCQSADDE